MRLKADQFQQGSVLLIILVLLLVLTSLAISSVRDSAMETRVMARDHEQRRLFNAAEAGLREGERRIAQASQPLQPCGTPPCLQGLASNDAVDFTNAVPYRSHTYPDAEVHWYIRQIPRTGGQPADPRYGASATQSGTYYYEISSRAFAPHARLSNTRRGTQCTDDAVCARSVTARTFIAP